jgi:hypothetical protein
MLKRVYMHFYLVVFALYVYLNRGIAYTYLAELTWLIGILMITRNWKNYIFPWDRKVALLVGFLCISLIYTIIGLTRYPAMDVVRDGFMFNYMMFALVIPVFKDQFEEFRKGIFRIYKWLPFVALAGLLLKTKILNHSSPAIFGGIPILEYKNGDLAVQLLITALLLITGNIRYSLRYQFLNAMVVIYLFFLIATFNRGGMLAFLVGMLLFLFYSRKNAALANIKSYVKIVLLLLCLAFPLYLLTNIKDPVQGRDTGVAQLQKNITSIFVKEEKTPLSGNIIWRLAWWTKIVDYTIAGPYFLTGKGLGINLATADGIKMQDNSLRSPHNFHMNVLARFGVPIAIAWLSFLVLVIRGIRKQDAPLEQILYVAVFVSFMVNASFDVALEGPMAAFPCWTFLGMLFYSEMLSSVTQTAINRVD